MADFEFATAVRGDVPAAATESAKNKIGRVAKLAHRPVLFGRLELRIEGDPALERPAVAKASLDVSGRIVRAHVAAPNIDEAIDRLEARLRRALETLEERREARRAESGLPGPELWRHGNLPTERPAFFPRPADEREVVAQKTFAIDRMSAEEAVFEMEMLHHDFLLFTNERTGADNVVYRKPEGGYGVIVDGEDPREAVPYANHISVEPGRAPTLGVDDAIGRLDVSGEPFVFFIDQMSGRGRVVYRRYDGHYGLIEVAEADAPVA